MFSLLNTGIKPAIYRLHTPDHAIAGNDRAVCIIEQQTMIPVAVRQVVQHLETVGVHDRETDRIVARNITDDLAVIRVHVMDGEPDILHHIVAKDILAAGIGVDAVAPVANDVADNLCAGRIPDGNAATGLRHAHASTANDLVAARDGICSTVQIDPVEVID